MRRCLCENIPLKIGSLIPLNEGEAKHLTSVLRLGPGHEVELIDGHGRKARAALVFRDKKVFAETLEAPNTDPRYLSAPVHLAMSILKGEAMEWVVEKSVELGVRSLIPIETEFCVVKTQKRGADTFQERWQRIADQAIKQCGRLDRMVIQAPVPLEDALLNPHHFIWLDEELAQSGSNHDHLAQILPALKTQSEFALLVGPEGGFSSAEKARLLQLTGSRMHEIRRAGLGSLILRAETAALLGISLLLGNHYGKK